MPRRCSTGSRRRSRKGFSQLKGVPLLTVSGKTGKGIDQLLGAAFEVRDNWSRRVTTGELNRWFERAVETNPPPAPGGKRIKLRYITQVKIAPAELRRVRHAGSTSCRPAISAICSIRCGATSSSGRCRCA